MRIKRLNTKKYSSMLLFFLLAVPVFGSVTDSISTFYKNGVFTTYSQVWVNASDSICDAVTRDYDYQMRYNAEALFSWALKGMNLRKEKNEMMMFYFKSTSFNKEKSILRSVGDVIVPGVITVPDVFVDCKLFSKPTTAGKNSVYLNLLKSNGFIDEMNNTFSIVSTRKGNWFILETHVKFSWFFNIFITQKRYKSIIEWRLNKFMHNLRDEAERREKKQPTINQKQIYNYQFRQK